MPLIHPSTYLAPPLLRDGHAQTIFQTVSRRVDGVNYLRERIDTPDGDFLDLDWSRVEADRVTIVSHGLEGDTKRAYMLGMVRALNRRGWDAVAWNFRGCSGEPNRQPRLYHSGASDDLATTLKHVESLKRYRLVALVGFSLGGNITLKLLGELGETARGRIAAAAAFSVPCDLAGSQRAMGAFTHRLYMRRFLGDLREKIRTKMKQFPGVLDDEGYGRIRTFEEFDERYTAPLHGFASAADYYAKASCRQFLPRIAVPTLLVNARDDPFLSEGCFPEPEARASEWLHLEMPEQGGHVGFVSFNDDGEYWSERRAGEFLVAQTRS